MKTMKQKLASLALLSALSLQPSAFLRAAPLGTAFTYQGRFSESGNPATGLFDFRFAIYDAAESGAQVGLTLTNNSVSVSNGLVTVALDFGASVFTDDARWLQIAVRTNGGGAFVPLTPRQVLTATPYALYTPSAGTATTAIAATNFIGVLAGQVTGTQGATVVAAVGGQSAANVATGASAANAAASANTPGTIVKRDASGNFSAGTITGNLTGNAATATTAASFTGALAGNVIGTQGATVVAAVGGQTAANVANGASAANAATAANTPATIVKRDPSGNFSAGAITVASVSGDGSGLDNLDGGSIVNGTATSAQLAPGAAVTNLQASGQSAVASGGLVLGNANNAAAMIAAGYASLGPTYLGETWLPTPTVGAPSVRRAHSAVWTGTEMIIWGGYSGSAVVNDGARYHPLSNIWLLVSSTNAPVARFAHFAVWTGTEMLIWGGMSSTNAGGRYNPATDTWRPVSTNGAPIGWYYGSAVWSGSEMLVWGGQDGTNPLVASGARYNPVTDTWATITTNGVPSVRSYHSAIWTGMEMIIWGGYTTTYANSGARYNPNTDTWTNTTLAGAPSGRYFPAAVWSGSEMIIWGGYAGGHPTTGGRYNPITDTWRAMTAVGAPVGRYWQWPVAAWTGTEMLVWGGLIYPSTTVNTGGRYNPATDVWTPTTLTGAPSARYQHTAVWTDVGYIVFGGLFGSTHLGAAASYVPGRLMYLYQRP